MKESFAQLFSPMTALAMVIFNHILSRISRPESGNCITLTMVAMSVLLADRGKSSNSGMGEEIVRDNRCFIVCDGGLGLFLTVVWVRSCQGGGVWNPRRRVDGSHWLSWTNATNKATLVKDAVYRSKLVITPNVIKSYWERLAMYLCDCNIALVSVLPRGMVK